MAQIIEFPKSAAKKELSTVARCAAAIREDLKKAFPGIKFAVRSKNFSMGDDVNVEYIDGPTTEKVNALIGKYQYGHFNGMEDIYEHTNRIEGLPQTKYLFVSRKLSEETINRWAGEIRTRYGLDPTTPIDFPAIESGSHRKDAIRDIMWREYEKIDTRDMGYECPGCYHQTRERNLQADDRIICNDCDYKAKANTKPTVNLAGEKDPYLVTSHVSEALRRSYQSFKVGTFYAKASANNFENMMEVCREYAQIVE